MSTSCLHDPLFVQEGLETEFELQRDVSEGLLSRNKNASDLCFLLEVECIDFLELSFL